MIVDHVFSFKLLCLLGYFMNWWMILSVGWLEEQLFTIFTLVWLKRMWTFDEPPSMQLLPICFFFLHRSIVRTAVGRLYTVEISMISSICCTTAAVITCRNLSTSGCSMSMSWAIEFAFVNSYRLLSFACWLFASFVARLFCFFSFRTLLEDFYCSRIVFTSFLGLCGKCKI